MLLYLVQHGKAKFKDEDPDRPVTDEGRDDVERMAEFLAGRDISVAAIWHSGKTRAAQTAEILAADVSTAEGVTRHDGLGPNDIPDPVQKEINSADSDLMIVGHLPFLNRLASLLITGRQDADVVAFQKGEIVCLECDDDGAWRLAWMVTPELTKQTRRRRRGGRE